MLSRRPRLSESPFRSIRELLSGFSRRLLTYSQPCDHCGGQIVQLDVAPESFRWQCPGCLCAWTPMMVLVHKGPFCPVHGTVPPPAPSFPSRSDDDAA